MLLSSHRIRDILYAVLTVTCITLLTPSISLSFSSNGFDFPLGTPNDRGGYPNGYMAGNGGYLWTERAWYADCGYVYHPGEDWNQSGTYTDWGRDNSDYGDPVFAISNGIVRHAGFVLKKTGDVDSGWGNIVVIEHSVPPNANFLLPDGGNITTVWSQYGHLRDIDTNNVVVGQSIKRGQRIGWVGDYPHGSGENKHLHFEIRRYGLSRLTPGFFPCDQNLQWVLDHYIEPTRFINNNRNTFTQATGTTWHPNGTLIKGTGPNIYFLENGEKRRFGNPDILRSWYRTNAIILVPESELNNFSEGAPVNKFRDGTLIKGSAGTVYIVTDNGQKRGFSSDSVFNGLRYDWDKIITISNEALSGYPEGQAITLTSLHPNGTIIHAEGDYRLFLLEKWYKRWIRTKEVLESYGWNPEDAILISADELNRYANGEALNFRDGSLIRGTDGRVYVIENNLKRYISSPVIFESFGFSWSDILDVPDEALTWHQSGAPLEEGPRPGTSLSIANQAVTRQIKPGESLEVYYVISNFTGHEMLNVRLSARIRQSEPQGSWIDYDPSNNVVITVPAKICVSYGPGDYYKRPFKIPETLATGQYDMQWLIINHNTGELLDSREQIKAFKIISKNEWKIADLNHDDRVDMADVAIMLKHWGSTSKPPADINQDGRVNAQDASIMMSNWYNP